jgi:hypothetical protein
MYYQLINADRLPIIIFIFSIIHDQKITTCEISSLDLKNGVNYKTKNLSITYKYNSDRYNGRECRNRVDAGLNKLDYYQL